MQALARLNKQKELKDTTALLEGFKLLVLAQGKPDAQKGEPALANAKKRQSNLTGIALYGWMAEVETRRPYTQIKPLEGVLRGRPKSKQRGLPFVFSHTNHCDKILHSEKWRRAKLREQVVMARQEQAEKEAEKQKEWQAEKKKEKEVKKAENEAKKKERGEKEAKKEAEKEEKTQQRKEAREQQNPTPGAEPKRARKQKTFFGD
jgi:hypothetical protein